MAVKIPLRLLNIEGDGFHLQAKVKINGKQALLIVDTGASRTVFDKTEITKFLNKEEVGTHDRLSTGLGTSSMESQFVVLGSLQLGTIKLEKFDAVILDLQHVNQTYSMLGFPAIAGVLGSDVLVAMKAVIDFRKRVMMLHPQRVKKAKKKAVRKTVKKAVKKTARKKRK